MNKVLVVLGLFLSVVINAYATPSVESNSQHGDWPTTTDVPPVSLYAHSATNVIAPMQVGVGNALATAQSATALVVVQPDTADTYVCTAPVGTARSAAAWQCYYAFISGSTTTVTWANGSSSATNVATNPSALSYS